MRTKLLSNALKNGVNWGGKREGAGRKSRGKTVVLSLRILPEYAERIRQEAKQQGVPTGKIVEQYIERGGK